jgi:hypothetical protein
MPAMSRKKRVRSGAAVGSLFGNRTGKLDSFRPASAGNESHFELHGLKLAQWETAVEKADVPGQPEKRAPLAQSEIEAPPVPQIVCEPVHFALISKTWSRNAKDQAMRTFEGGKPRGPRIGKRIEIKRPRPASNRRVRNESTRFRK